jgi:serine/threonine protein kinase
MPPESLKNNQYSYKSDIWSIGIIAYELVHGKAPWKDKNDAVLFQKMTSTPI